MKKNRVFLLVALALFVVLPFGVNAGGEVKKFDDVVYTIEFKKIEEYMCDDVKGHWLVTNYYGEYNKLQVYDLTTGKMYLLDLSKKGVCSEISDEMEYDVPYYEYSYNDNNLYLDTYSNDLDWYLVKASNGELGEEFYYVKNNDGSFSLVEEPELVNIENYYESRMFEPAKGEYNSRIDYYVIVDPAATMRELKEVKDEDKNIDDFNDGKYYVFAQPVSSEIITVITTTEFIVDKDEIGFENDFVGSKDNFLYHIVHGDKAYLVFIDVDSQVRFVFDGAGNYQTFGYDNILIKDVLDSNDGEYLYLVCSLDNEEYHLVLDSDYRKVLSIKKENRLDYISLAGNVDNKGYFLFGEASEEIIELNKYALISGDNQKFIDEDLAFKFTGDINKLISVKVNNKVLEEDKDYNKEEGSTIITLKKSYLETLPKGEYTLKVEYSDGGYVETIFTVESGLENPNTFDGIGSNILTGIISLVGLLFAVIYLKRKNRVGA